MKEELMGTKLHEGIPDGPNWIGWAPLIIIPAGVICLRGRIQPWELMWGLSIAIFSGSKWWTWWRFIKSRLHTAVFRSFAYLFLWPGMNAGRFLSSNPPAETPAFASWAWAGAKTVFGAGLVWGIARLAGHGLLAGWIGMVGFIFLLHFGLFALLALFWQSLGIDAQPLMNHPVATESLSDFWGSRWNAGFRDLVFGSMFIPLARRFGSEAATFATFLVSGLIHELVITIPTGAGYGLPTFYFTLQGTGVILERSVPGRKLLATRLCGRAFAIALIILPLFALVPPSFIRRVMVPFLSAVKALP